MLITYSRFLGTPILSVQTSSPIGTIAESIIDPDSLKILGFYVNSPLINHNTGNILDVTSIREYSKLGIIIDGIDELVSSEDVVKIKKIIELDFNLINLKVETKKGSKLGKVLDFNMTPEDFMIQQLIVKRPPLKSFLDTELVIPRHEIVEITDYKVIVKDEEKVIKEKAAKENFIPNFVNPFREKEFAPAETEKKSD